MRLPKHTKTNLIRSLPLFADCTRSEIAEIDAIADEIVLRAGRVLAKESATGQEFVVIARGHAAVERQGTRIATLEAGDFFGEAALITGQPRNATVVAITPVDVLVIEGHAFRRLLEDSPSIRAKVEKALAERTPAAS